MSKNREAELEELFQKLDVNQDGSICISDLVATLSEHNSNSNRPLDISFANIFLRNADRNKDGVIDFSEFVNYIENRDHRISLAFKEIDRDGNDIIDLEDIKAIFKKLDIFLSTNEAENLLKRIDKVGKLNVSIDEWRDFLFFHPAHSLEQIAYFWQHGNFIDAGADWIIPEEFESGNHEVSLQLKRLLAGGFAGAVSRTCTAPLDRVKVLLQVHGYKHVNSGIVQAVKYMVSEGGILSLWRGNGINVMKIVPESALKYSLYEYYKLLLRRSSDSDKASQSLQEKFLAGSLAGVSSQTVIYPLEFLPHFEFDYYYCFTLNSPHHRKQIRSTVLYKELSDFNKSNEKQFRSFQEPKTNEKTVKREFVIESGEKRSQTTLLRIIYGGTTYSSRTDLGLAERLYFALTTHG